MCLLDRNWETDQAHFRTFLERFTTHPCGECVFLCPEGTTRTAKNIAKSKAFAAKTNRPQFDVSVSLSQEEMWIHLFQQLRTTDSTNLLQFQLIFN